MEKRRSLKKTWYGFIILITILPMIILISWIGYRSHSLLLNNAILREAQFNKEIKTSINLETNRIITLLQNKGDPMAFTLTRRLDKDVIWKLFEVVFSREKAINSLSLISRENQVILSMDREETILNGNEINKNDSDNESVPQVYEHLIHTKPPMIVIPLHGRTYVGSPTFNEHCTDFSISVPVGQLSHPVAVLVATISTNKLWNNIKSIFLRSGVSTYLVDSLGSLLLKPSGSDLHTGKLVTHMNIIRTLIANKEWDSTESYTGLNEKPVFGISSYIDTLNWGVISEIPRKQITDPIFKTILSVSGLILFIVLLSGGIGLIIVSRILKPLSLLNKAFGSVSKGNYDVKLESSPVKEIDYLVGGFNNMTQEINYRENEISGFAHILEESLNEIYIFDAKTLRFVQVNKGARQNLDYSMKELRNLTPLDIKPDFTAESFEKIVEPLRVGEKKMVEFRTVHQRKDGSLYDVEVFLQLSSFHSASVFVAIILDITARKQTEEALMQSEQRLRDLLDYSPSLIFMKDLSGKYLFINRRYEVMFNIKNEDIVNKTDHDIFPKEIADVFRANDIHVAEQGEIVEIEEPAQHGDGNVHTYLSVKFPVRGASGEIYATCGISTDITERIKAETQSRKLLQAVEYSSTTVMITDTRGNIEYANPTFAKLTGYSIEETIGNNPRILQSGKMHPEVYGELWRTIKSGDEWKGELCNKKKDGKLYWEHVSISPVKDDEGAITNFIAVKDDITGRIQAEEALRESEEKYRAMFETSKVGMALCKMDGTLIESNQAYLEIIGYTKEEALQLSYWDITPIEFKEFEARQLRSLEDTGRYGPYEKEYIRKNGNRIPVLLNGVTVKGSDGNDNIWSVVQDITERKKMEVELIKYQQRLETLVEERTKELESSQEKLVEAERLAVLGKLSGGIAHEIRNPLATINISALNLKKKLKDADEMTTKHIDRIVKHVKNSSQIIQSLQDLAKMKEPETGKFDIYNIIEDGISTVNTPQAVKITKDVAKEEMFVDVDEKQISIVFRNVLSNAIEAMDNKGTIWIAACKKGDSWIDVTIKDTGHGISTENLKRIFESFFGTKVKGFGYGLTICKMIMEKHGGKIAAQSEEGEGATFILSFPHGDSETTILKK